MTAVLEKAPLVSLPVQRKESWRPSGRLVRRLGLAIVLAAIGTLHLANIGGWPLFDNDDEGTYVAQAWAVLHKGHLAHYTYWYDHPPFGWIQLAVIMEPFTWFTHGEPSIVAGRLVMALYTVVSGALLYCLGRNLGLRSRFALLAPLLWAMSPLVVLEGRQVFLDNLQLPWLIGSLVLATNRSKNLWLHVASGVCFGLAVLTKPGSTGALEVSGGS